MYKRELLSEFTTMNLLTNGEVGIKINGIIHWTKVADDCLIGDNFNPHEYVVITDTRYRNWRMVTNARESEMHQALLAIAKQIEPGDRIHLKSINGMYKVVSVENYEMVLTCDTWFRTSRPKRRYHVSDFKCKAGGINAIKSPIEEG